MHCVAACNLQLPLSGVSGDFFAHIVLFVCSSANVVI